MSEQSGSREQAEASAEQELELKDLAVQNAEADQVRGGGTTTPTTTTKPAPKGAFEVKDFGFSVENP